MFKDMPDWLEKYMDVPGWTIADLSTMFNDKSTKSKLFGPIPPQISGLTLRQILEYYFTAKIDDMNETEKMYVELLSLYHQYDYLRKKLDVYTEPSKKNDFSVNFDVPGKVKQEIKDELSKIPVISFNDVKNTETDQDKIKELSDKLNKAKTLLNDLAEKFNKSLEQAYFDYHHDAVEKKWDGLERDKKNCPSVSAAVESKKFIPIIPQYCSLSVNHKGCSPLMENLENLVFKTINPDEYVESVGCETTKSWKNNQQDSAKKGSIIRNMVKEHERFNGLIAFHFSGCKLGNSNIGDAIAVADVRRKIFLYETPIIRKYKERVSTIFPSEAPNEYLSGNDDKWHLNGPNKDEFETTAFNNMQQRLWWDWCTDICVIGENVDIL